MKKYKVFVKKSQLSLKDIEMQLELHDNSWQLKDMQGETVHAAEYSDSSVGTSWGIIEFKYADKLVEVRILDEQQEYRNNFKEASKWKQATNFFGPSGRAFRSEPSKWYPNNTLNYNPAIKDSDAALRLVDTLLQKGAGKTKNTRSSKTSYWLVFGVFTIVMVVGLIVILF